MIPQSLRSLVTGAIVLVFVFVTGVIGYVVLGDRDWLDATYMMVITIATVGFGEHSDLEPGEKVWTIIVIVFGISAVAYVLGGFLRKMTEGEIQRALGLQRTSKEISRLQGHTIVCGFGRMGQILCEELHTLHQPFVIIERKPERITEAQNLGYLCSHGDATEEEVLLATNVSKAKNLVSALASDADNVYIALTARNLCPQLKIIARGEYPSTRKKLLQAGADRVVLPAAIGARACYALEK